MATLKTGKIAVHGATLYYEIRGAGPTLLFIAEPKAMQPSGTSRAQHSPRILRSSAGIAAVSLEAQHPMGLKEFG